jgi:flavodoxin
MNPDFNNEPTITITSFANYVADKAVEHYDFVTWLTNSRTEQFEDMEEDWEARYDELLTRDVEEAIEQFDMLMANYDVIGIHDLDTYANWADDAYDTMRKLTNTMPILHWAAYEDATHDIREEEIDWFDDSYNVEDYHEDNWSNAYEDNAVEYFDQVEA